MIARRVLTVVAIVATLVWSQSARAQACSSPITTSDLTAIKSVIEAYRTAWLRGDAVGVQRTFTEASVLHPARGSKPIVGMEAIKDYWWPKNAPATKILQLDITVKEVGGDTCFAFARGTDNVAWSTTQDGRLTRTRHHGTFLNVMEKMPDGNWRILQHMWDDQPDENF